MATAIFGSIAKLQKRARVETETEKQPLVDFNDLGPSMSYEDREDLLNDLLEEDESTFPLLLIPTEVLQSVLLMLPVNVAVRLRAVCHAKCDTIDAHAGLWAALLMRDFNDLGGLATHYKGLHMTAAGWNNRKVVRRLEWDPLMICSPPALRYVLLAASATRKSYWDEHGHSLGAGWSWFSTKVCRRMATSTFKRWASVYHGKDAVENLLTTQPPEVTGTSVSSSSSSAPPVAALVADDSGSAPAAQESDSGSGWRFRCGRTDAVMLSQEAAADIYNTVQQWHNAAHREAMRAHLKGEVPDPDKTAAAESAAAASMGFSVTPTLDVAEAVAIAAAENAAAEAASIAAAMEAGGGGGAAAEGAARGAASHRLEEAQLRLALEMSKEEAERSRESADAAKSNQQKLKLDEKAKVEEKVEQQGLALKTEAGSPDVVVFLKENCLAAKVDSLPDQFNRSIDHIVSKMVKKSWGLLYESVSEEIGFRAKSAAYALRAANAAAVDLHMAAESHELEQERMCLPIWRSKVMTGLSRLRGASCDGKVRQARCALITQAHVEWCELEDYTVFLDEQLGQLELAIDNERGNHDMISRSHTPHVRDMGRLMFRNCCLLDSRIFRHMCFAAYALVHEIDQAQSTGDRDDKIESLERLHEMLVACDVADDHLSESQDTKEMYGENLVKPITAAMERYAPWDIKGAVPDDKSTGGVKDRRGRIGRQQYKHVPCR